MKTENRRIFSTKTSDNKVAGRLTNIPEIVKVVAICQAGQWTCLNLQKRS